MDALCSEYGWPAAYVFFDLPFAMAQHLASAMAERKGSTDGNGFVDRTVTRARREMKKYLEANYQII